jgi:hypothetical protein
VVNCLTARQGMRSSIAHRLDTNMLICLRAPHTATQTACTPTQHHQSTSKPSMVIAISGASHAGTSITLGAGLAGARGGSNLRLPCRCSCCSTPDGPAGAPTGLPGAPSAFAALCREAMLLYCAAPVMLLLWVLEPGDDQTDA